MVKNDGVLKSGVFSIVVLDELERQSPQAFPADLSALAEHLTGRFQELRAAG